MNVLKSIARIFDKEQKQIGTGFVVTPDGLIATCAHVLGEPKPDKAFVVFQDEQEEREAIVLTEGWRPSNMEDIALLQLCGTLPEHVHPLPLGSSHGIEGHTFLTFGYPDAGEVEGVRAIGSILGRGPRIGDGGYPLLQLRSSEITNGFSGAPVWDELRRRVVGMVMIKTLPDSSGRLGETAFAMPAETLQAVSSALCVSDVCPYRELRVFTEADAQFFFGREHVIRTLIENLQNKPRFLAIFGASGSGKSSVVQAGLIPLLRSGKVPNIDDRHIILTRPTDTSFEHYLSHFNQASASGVLVIDQYEELFIPSDETTSVQVATHLAHLLEHTHITLIIVMRDDFYSLFMQQESLARRLNGSIVNVWPTLNREEVETIIEQPARTTGWRFEEGLVKQIVDDAMATSTYGKNTAKSSTILPLLEFTLTQLWEKHQDGILTHEAYHSVGGITGGLKQWANNAYDSFEESQRPLVRRIFMDLVHIGDKEQHIPNSRRRRPFSTLIRNDAEWTSISHIVQRLVAKRLLVISQDEATSQDDKSRQKSSVEIIHDALLREWYQLQRWIEDDFDFLSWYQDLERQVQSWLKMKRFGHEGLLRGNELKRALDYLKQRSDRLTSDDHQFIHASQNFQRRRTIISSILAISVAGSVSGFVGKWILEQSKHYNDVGIYTGHSKPVHCVAWSPEGSRLASGSVDQTVQIYLSNGEKIYTYTGHHGTVSAVAWSPDGYKVASASGDKTVQIWPSDSAGTQPPAIYRRHHAVILSLAWSPDGSTLASGSGTPEHLIHCWNANTLELRYSYSGHTQPVNGLTWSPDGTALAAASGDGTVHILNAATGKLLFAYAGHQFPSHVISVAWSPNGQYIASSGYEGAVHVWSAKTGKALNIYRGHANRPVFSVSWSPDNVYVASASVDKTVQIWTALEGTRVCTYDKHSQEVESVTWAHPGNKSIPANEALLASSGLDDTVRIWQLT